MEPEKEKDSMEGSDKDEEFIPEESGEMASPQLKRGKYSMDVPTESDSVERSDEGKAEKLNKIKIMREPKANDIRDCWRIVGL